MSVRVDLLKPEEYRYQGAVSREFAIRVSIVGGSCLLLLLGLIALVNGRVVRQQLASAKAAWERVEPRYKSVSAVQMSLAETSVLRTELEGWGRSRIVWHTQMQDLQRIVPANVQLTELSVKSSYHMLMEEGAAEEAAATPARQFKLLLEGVTTGDQADKVVVNFVDALRADPTLKESLESIKLQGLQQRGQTQEEAMDRVFGIEATSRLRELK